MKTESLGLKGVIFILAIMLSLLGFVSNGHPQSTWSIVTIPDLPSGASLGRLWTDQPGNLYVWASTNVPEAFLFHWDGTSWNQVLHLPNHKLGLYIGHVFGTGPSDVFASAYDNTNNRLKMYHYDGISWEEQLLPAETYGCERLRGIVGEPGNVYAFAQNCGSPVSHILRYDGISWQVVHSSNGGVVPAYISQDEIYATTCWGHSLWNGTSWTWYGGFDFCDVWDTWGMRDGDGILHLYTSGANNFNNGVRVWQFIEDSRGSKTGSWGSNYGTVFSDPPGYGYRDAGNIYGIWGSGPDDIYVVGWRHDGDPDPDNNGRVYHFNGTAWERITALEPIPSAYEVWGSGPDDVWVSLSGGRLLHYGSVNQPLSDFINEMTKVEYKLGRNGGIEDKLEIKWYFTLGAGNDGFDLLAEDVEFTVGDINLTILAGSFQFDNEYVLTDACAVFADLYPDDTTCDEKKAKGKIKEENGYYKFEVRLDKCELPEVGTVNPLHIELLIGNDKGEADLDLLGDHGKVEFKGAKP